MTIRLLDKTCLIWIYDGSLDSAMDSATWLRTVEELRNSGWQKTILLAAGPSGCRLVHGVEVFCIERPDIYFLRQAMFHIRVVQFVLQRWDQTDIILFHEISAPWILPLRLFRFFKRRHQPILVMDTRSLPMPHPQNEKWKDEVRRYAYNIFVWLGNHYADGRLAITQRMADAIHIPKDKLWGTWPSGAAEEHFSNVRVTRQWPSGKEAVQLVYHGSMHHERNLLVLCQAVAQAKIAGMSFELTLVGDGTQRKELEAFAAHSDAPIHVLAPVSYQAIPEILAEAHVGVLPFPDEEKFRVSSPIKLFEYMAAGLPVLATRVVCHTDVVGAGEFVFWAEDSDEQGLLDAMRMIWAGRDLLSKMGQNAFFASAAWTWKVSAEKLRNALESGLQKRGAFLRFESSNPADPTTAEQTGD